MVSGADAESWLSNLMTNNMPEVGKMVLSPMLNEFGKVIGDFTIAQVDKNKFYIWGLQNAQKHHMRWFHKHLNKGEDVSIDCIDLKMVAYQLRTKVSRHASKINRQRYIK